MVNILSRVLKPLGENLEPTTYILHPFPWREREIQDTENFGCHYVGINTVGLITVCTVLQDLPLKQNALDIPVSRPSLRLSNRAGRFWRVKRRQNHKWCNISLFLDLVSRERNQHYFTSQTSLPRPLSGRKPPALWPASGLSPLARRRGRGPSAPRVTNV